MRNIIALICRDNTVEIYKDSIIVESATRHFNNHRRAYDYAESVTNNIEFE